MQGTDKIWASIKWIYLVYAVFSVVLLATITPAFQVPDETNHFLRAEQVSRGVLIPAFHWQSANHTHVTSTNGRIVYPDSGSYIGSLAIRDMDQIFEDIKFHPEHKITTSAQEKAKKIRWNSETGPVQFPNTAIYPPTGYVFQALAIVIGKATHLRVLDTLIVARIVNGLACAFICFFALSIANRSRILIFFVLLLPMILSLFASVSQDPLLISLAALLAGIIDRFESDPPKSYTPLVLVIMVCCITMISISRPPYFLLVFVLPFLSVVNRVKWIALAASLLLFFIWFLLNASNYAVVFAPADMQVNAALQLSGMLHHPTHFISVFFHFNRAIISNYLHEFIGILGWLDLPLPGFYYRIAEIMLLLTVAVAVSFHSTNNKLRIALAMIFAGMILAIFTAQYVTWSTLDSDSLEGVQSRYFFPPFLIGSLAIAGFSKEWILTRRQWPIVYIIIIFPLFTQIIVIQHLIIRYYLSS